MAIRPVVIYGNPVLHRPAAPVTAFDDEFKALVTDMYETMDAAHGVGLAAPQIGVGLRVFTYQMENEDGVPARGCIVNPRLTLGKVSALMTKKKGVFRSRATVFLSNVLSGLLSMDLMSKAIRSGLRQLVGLPAVCSTRPTTLMENYM